MNNNIEIDVNNMENKDLVCKENSLKIANNWTYFINICSRKQKEHARQSSFWFVIFSILTIINGIITAIVAAEGIGDMLSKDVLVILGIAGVVNTVIMGTFNPGVSKGKHDDSTKFFRLLKYNFITCESLSNFVELQNRFQEFIKEEDSIFRCFSVKPGQTPEYGEIVKMNPKLSHELYQLKIRYEIPERTPEAIVYNSDTLFRVNPYDNRSVSI